MVDYSNITLNPLVISAPAAASIAVRRAAAMAKRLNIRSRSRNVFDDLTFRNNVFKEWLPGLGQPPLEPTPIPQPPKLCSTCGRNKLTLKTEGKPGWCVECRFHWLAEYRAAQAHAAGVMVATASPARKPGQAKVVNGKQKSKFDWSKY